MTTASFPQHEVMQMLLAWNDGDETIPHVEAELCAWLFRELGRQGQA